jgi:ABC-type antimicrobial peptide transport system permease subunit
MIRVVRRDREAGSGNDGEPMEIVGIAPPIRDTLFSQQAEPHLYVPLGRHHRASLFIHVRTRDAGTAAEANLLGSIRREIGKVDARLPVLDFLSMPRFHERSLELWAIRAGGGLVISLGAVALLLAVAGVYGVKSYVVSQRTREFGIRVAVGARPRDVMWMVLGEGLVLTGIGVAVGLILAALAGVGLSRLLYQVSPLDPVVFLLAPATLAAAAAVASWVPARRATRVAPATALRTE